MRRDLDRSIANEMLLLEALGQAFDTLAERGPSAWLDAEIARLNRELDAMRAEGEAQ